MVKIETSKRNNTSVQSDLDMIRIPPCQGDHYGSRAEFVIRRANPGVPVTAEKDFLEGFFISEVGGKSWPVKFTHWTQDVAECETPWGGFSISAEESRGFEWVVKRNDEAPVGIKIKLGTYLEFALPNGMCLRFKNRTGLGARIYRYRDSSGEIEIRTETVGMIRSNPFPRERMKQWRITIKGGRMRDRPWILPLIVSFLCYYKIYRRGRPGFFDKMF